MSDGVVDAVRTRHFPLLVFIFTLGMAIVYYAIGPWWGAALHVVLAVVALVIWIEVNA